MLREDTAAMKIHRLECADTGYFAACGVARMNSGPDKSEVVMSFCAHINAYPNSFVTSYSHFYIATSVSKKMLKNKTSDVKYISIFTDTPDANELIV